MQWSVVYRSCYNEDGSLYFPQRLTHEFLENAKQTLGSYIFCNQYQNEIIPADKQCFKKEWFRYYDELPKRKTTFIFVDPALSEADTSDYTGVVVVHVGANKNWYVSHAQRYRVNPSELVDLMFRLNKEFKPQGIGIETIAYQKALIYFLADEMRRRNEIIPIKDIKYPTTNSKQTRILSLVPRIEFGHLYLNRGLNDLELELLQFPRGSHDDLIDALNSIDYLAFPPDDKEEEIKKPHSPNDPMYETWYRQNLLKRSLNESGNEN